MPGTAPMAGVGVARVSSAQRRNDLVRAALRVIDRDGVHAATTRAIVAEADVPLATFHYVFRSRDELIRELITHVVENESLAAAQSLQHATDIRTLIRGGLRAYLDLVISEPGHEQAVFELFHYALRTDELGDLPRTQYEAYHRAAETLLALGAERAGIRWRIPAADLARVLVTVTDGLTLAWLADRDTDAAARTIDHVSDLLSSYAAPSPHPAHSQGANA